MSRLLRSLALLAALLMAATGAFAQTTIPVSNSAYTDLGAGPMSLGVAGGAIVYQIGASQPSATLPGFKLNPGSDPTTISTTSHVWALATSGASVNAIVMSAAAIPAPPLPSGAATAAGQPALNGDGGALAHVTNFPSTQPTTTSNGALESGGNLAAINTSVNSQIPAGGNVIGKVGIDHTTPGVTDAVLPVDSAYYGPGSCSSSCNGTTLLGPIDTTGYKSIDWQMTAIGSGAVTSIQGSDDPVCSSATNWVNGIPFVLTVPGGSTTISATTSNDLNFLGAVVTGVEFHCYRLAFTAYTGGTYTAEALLRAKDTILVRTAGGVSIVPIPGQGTPVMSGLTGTTGAVAPSLAAVSNRTNWVCHVEVTSSGTTTAALFAVTLTGLNGGTATLEYWAPTTGQGQVVRDFNPCIPASSTNTAITLSVPALGSGTSAVSAMLAGYYE